MSFLVADYGASDSESEVEQAKPHSEDRTDNTNKGTKRKFQLPSPKATLAVDASVADRPNLSFPPPNRSTTVVSRPAKTKKAKGPVKIYLPSLSGDGSDDDDDDGENGDQGEENDVSKKPRTAGGMSALFAMLPKPKNSCAPKVTAMMPASVAAKGKEKGKRKKPATVNDEIRSKEVQRAEEAEETDDAESERLEDWRNAGPARDLPLQEPIKQFPSANLGPSTAPTSSSSFFKRFRTEEDQDDDDDEATLQGPSAPEGAHYQYPYEHSSGEQYPQGDPNFHQQWEAYPNPYPHDQYYHQQQQEHTTQQQSSEAGCGEDVLDAETLAKLGGFRGRHRGPIHIQTVDVSQAVGPYNPIKNASVPTSTSEASYAHLKPSRMQKSKHNIMALAFQAKSMEDKLQESWAQSRKTKRQTQAKYGF